MSPERDESHQELHPRGHHHWVTSFMFGRRWTVMESLWRVQQFHLCCPSVIWALDPNNLTEPVALTAFSLIKILKLPQFPLETKTDQQRELARSVSTTKHGHRMSREFYWPNLESTCSRGFGKKLPKKADQRDHWLPWKV